MRRFSREELARGDGRNGNPAFVAYQGKVYDVSSSFLWQHGRHQALHSAGADLSESLEEAPHGPDMLEAFPVVGELAQD